MNLTVIGTGYVGLVTGTCLADMGNNVTCVDINEEKVKTMQNGKIPIYEPNLEELFSKNINRRRLHFTTNLEKAINDSTIIFLALRETVNKFDYTSLFLKFEVIKNNF